MLIHKNFTQILESLKNKAIKFSGIISSLVTWVLFLFFFSYLFYKGGSAIIHYGFKNIFLTFQYNNIQNSFWAPFAITLFLALVVTLFTIPIAIRCSIWCSFYCSKTNKKIISAILLILANIPSIILGLFAKRYISLITLKILQMKTSLNLITASIALVCMILPIIISLFNAVLKDQKQLLISAEILGISKSKTIYKVIMPKLRNTIWIAITMIVSRISGESIMLSLLLSSSNYQSSYKGGFSEFINSQVNSVAPLISDNFFADGSDINSQNLMFLFGGLLLINSLLFNYLCLWFINKKQYRKKNNSKLSKYSQFKYLLIWRILCELTTITNKLKLNQISIDKYIFEWKRGRIEKILKTSHKLWEIICVLLFSFFAIAILSSIVIEGIIAIASSNNSYFSLNQNSLLRTTINTFLVIILSICSTIPIAICSSIYLSEYAKNKRFKKYTLALINTFNSTPSIIFGILGLSLFINTFGWTSTGSKGKSLLSGILTMILLILPYLSHLFYTHISSVHDSYREASNMLGIYKHKTFFKIILPLIGTNLIFSTLITIGKIMGETAPLYLTAGLNNIGKTLLMYPGQTLVTRIYSQLSSTNLNEAYQIMNETSLLCLILITILIIIGKYRIFLFKKHAWKGRVNSLKWQLHCMFWFRKKQYAKY